MRTKETTTALHLDTSSRGHRELRDVLGDGVRSRLLQKLLLQKLLPRVGARKHADRLAAAGVEVLADVALAKLCALDRPE